MWLSTFLSFSVSFLKKEENSGERKRKVNRRLGMERDIRNQKQDFKKKNESEQNENCTDEKKLGGKQNIR